MTITIATLILIALTVAALAAFFGMKVDMAHVERRQVVDPVWDGVSPLRTVQHDSDGVVQDQLTDPMNWHNHAGRMPGDIRPDPMAHCYL